MDILMHAAVIWFIIGFILFLLEFVVPGLILFFFALGAWIVAILSLFMPDLSVNIQLIVFVITSILSIFLLRDWVKKRIYGAPTSKDLLEDEFMGKTALVVAEITPDTNGSVDFKGTTWPATSEETIAKGEKAIIIGNESILLIVKSTKTI